MLDNLLAFDAKGVRHTSPGQRPGKSAPHIQSGQRPASYLLAFILLCLIAGCTTPKTPPKNYTFFPPAPDEPRVQFLTSFQSDLDLGWKSGFSEFLTGKSTAEKKLVKPYGLAIKDGVLYVCDSLAANIEVFDLVKKKARYFTPRAEGLLQTPINITIDKDGTRYVTDTGRSQVLIFGKDDSYLGALGVKDELKPSDLVLTADRLYIADIKGHCVRVYSKGERKLLFSIPRDPKAAEGQLYSPTNLALDDQKRLLVSDIGAFAVQVYDLEGNFIRTIGRQGVAPGMFARPKGIAVDRDGRAYVVDAATQVVQMFDTEGKLLLFFGSPGASASGELYLPAAVKVDYDNTGLFQKYAAPGRTLEYLILVTSQFGDNKISVYGFLRGK